RDGQILAVGDGALQRLLGQRPQEFLGVLGLGLLGGRDRLIKQTDLRFRFGGRGFGLAGHFGSAHCPPSFSLSSPDDPSTPSAAENCFSSSLFCSTRSKTASRSSDRSIFVIKSLRWLRVSSSFLSAGTCSTTLAGLKSSIDRNFR